jgi:hypothetical protein
MKGNMTHWRLRYDVMCWVMGKQNRVKLDKGHVILFIQQIREGAMPYAPLSMYTH